jgi:hypothetical protein
MVQAIKAAKEDALGRTINFGLALHDREQRNVGAAAGPKRREQPLDDTGFDGVPRPTASERSPSVNRRANGKTALDVAPSCRSDGMAPRGPRKHAQQLVAPLVVYAMGSDDTPATDTTTVKPSATLATAGPATERRASRVGNHRRCLLYLTNARELCVMHVQAWPPSCGEVRLTLTSTGLRWNLSNVVRAPVQGNPSRRRG